MKVSKKWLQKFFDDALPSAEALAEGLTFHAFEIESVERVGDDDVLDVKVTPNRGHDALSHRGIAKELSAIFEIPLAHDPFAETPVLAPVTNAVSVSVAEPALCKRYIAGVIKGVKVGPSPQWLRERLEAVGQRSINNVVDATNFVMFNLGQPLHAFDLETLNNTSLGVRLAKEGEEMFALDQKKYALEPSMLVITAGDAPVGIAGVKGGMPAGITEATKDIVIESANFDGVCVRKTAAALKLRTDASTRFEQVLSPELAAYGMRAAADLIQKIAGGELVGFVDVYPSPYTQTPVAVSVEHINRVLGTTLTGAEVADALVRLGLHYKEEGGMFSIVPPFERLDLSIAEDVIEEVARIVGYEKIAAHTLSLYEKTPEVNANVYAAEAAREELASKGYSEVYTSVFAEEGEYAVLNKVDSVRPYLRSTLVNGLQEALKKNIPNKDLLGLKEIKLFEIGVVWKGGEEKTMIGIVGEKEPATEMLLVGPADPKGYGALPLSSTLRFQPFSKYPYIVRDIALWAGGAVAGPELVEGLQEMITKEAGEWAQKIYLFDTFTKEGRTSLAFRIIFQSFERTLTEAEVNTRMEKVTAACRAGGFEVR